MSVGSSTGQSGRLADGGAVVDGRHARRDRNRERVVDALLDLYEEGEHSPSIRQVANRSGVSHRSVFRYFEDIDELCRVAIERHGATYADLIDIDNCGQGPFSERVDNLVECRMRLYEKVAAVARVTRMKAPMQDVLAEKLDTDRRGLNVQLSIHFKTEIEAMADDERDAARRAAEVICSIDSIELMRYSRGMTPAQTAAALRIALRKLLGPTDGTS